MNYNDLIHNGNRGSRCYCKFYGNDNELIYYHGNAICYGTDFVRTTGVTDISVFFNKEDNYFSDEDMLRWSEYIKLCGFPHTYEGVEDMHETHGYQHFIGNMLHFKFKTADYFSGHHSGAL
jgi:hypothetical protein